MNNGLIPFNLEAWESGEYEAVTRNDWITKIYEISHAHIYGRINCTLVYWNLDGTAEIDHFRLMLRKKTKKVWFPIYKMERCESKEECELLHSKNVNFIKAIQVEI